MAFFLFLFLKNSRISKYQAMVKIRVLLNQSESMFTISGINQILTDEELRTGRLRHARWQMWQSSDGI